MRRRSRKEATDTMVFKDLQDWLRSRLSFGGNGGTRRPDGGTSCYRPVQRKNRQEEALAREKAAEYEAGRPQVAYAHTGFTGMNPPMGGGVPYSDTQAADPYGYGAAQAARQESWGVPPAENPGGWGAPAEEPAPGSNISYMPGVYAPDAGSTFTHVEHILAITSLRSCYEAIECMKNGETLIMTLDTIGSESERIRCQDMLAGAAFTLGCSVRTIPSAGTVLIAPAGVKILPEQQRSNPDRGVYTAAQPQAAPVEQGYIPRRERRSSPNAAGWENPAGETGRGYNPYTGSMPAAAGGYGAYGGYGTYGGYGS